MILDGKDIGIKNIEAYYVIHKNSSDKYIKVISNDDKSISFTICDDFDPRNIEINKSVDLIKHIFWDIELITNESYYLFDITKDKVNLTRIDDNLFKLEVNVDKPEMIYSPLGDNATFNNLIINVDISFIYEKEDK